MSPLARSTNFAARMGRWSARHRKTAVFGWLAFVVLAFLLGSAVGTKKLDPESIAAGPAEHAQAIIDRGEFPKSADESVLVQSRAATADDAAFRAVVRDVVAKVSSFEAVQNVKSPLERENAALVSKDGRSALVQFEIKGSSDESTAAVAPILAAVAAVQAANPAFVVEEFGSASAGKALDETIEADFQRAEYMALPITLGILIVVFGALVAAGIPLLLGLSAVGAAIALSALPSHWFPMDDSASSVVLLIGLAVGVDYSLFYLKREREERAAGRGHEAALEAAAATSGRAVLISGGTVIVALAGLFLGGTAIWTSMAIGTIMVVAIAVAGSLTVLPALLSWLGDRVEKGRIPFVGRLRRDGDSRVWGAILDRVLRRPLVSAVAAGGLLLALATPTLVLHTELPGAASLPRDLAVMQTYERIQAAFPGGPLPAVVAVEATDVAAPEVQAALADLREEALATGLMQDPIQVQASPTGRVALVSVPLAGEGAGDAASERALTALRDDVLPATLGTVRGLDYGVTGEVAVSRDFNGLMKERAPFVFGFVLALAFLLLLVSFRSVVIAAKAIVLNLLSVGAAYGLLVAVFQWGWGESLLGFESTGAITSWLPVFMFVILFGLSMDYHVFILSRVREAFDRGLSTEEAVAHGIKATAGVVSAAAFVMVAVFGVFVTLSTVDMKQAGFGLATAIAIDATLVRAVLLPAAMKLLGDWNWYLPRWLSWLPQVSHETEAAPTAVPALRPAGR